MHFEVLTPTQNVLLAAKPEVLGLIREAETVTGGQCIICREQVPCSLSEKDLNVKTNRIGPL